jgi:hypothetical protein
MLYDLLLFYFNFSVFNFSILQYSLEAILKMCYITSDKYWGVHFLAVASYGRFF